MAGSDISVSTLQSQQQMVQERKSQSPQQDQETESPTQSKSIFAYAEKYYNIGNPDEVVTRQESGITKESYQADTGSIQSQIASVDELKQNVGKYLTQVVNNLNTAFETALNKFNGITYNKVEITDGDESKKASAENRLNSDMGTAIHNKIASLTNEANTKLSAILDKVKSEAGQETSETSENTPTAEGPSADQIKTGKKMSRHVDGQKKEVYKYNGKYYIIEDNNKPTEVKVSSDSALTNKDFISTTLQDDIQYLADNNTDKTNYQAVKKDGQIVGVTAFGKPVKLEIVHSIAEQLRADKAEQAKVDASAQQAEKAKAGDGAESMEGLNTPEPATPDAPAEEAPQKTHDEKVAEAEAQRVDRTPENRRGKVSLTAGWKNQGVSEEMQTKLQESGTTADNVLASLIGDADTSKLDMAKLKSELIRNNPSIFTQDGKVFKDADFSKLDFPKDFATRYPAGGKKIGGDHKKTLYSRDAADLVFGSPVYNKMHDYLTQNKQIVSELYSKFQKAHQADQLATQRAGKLVTTNMDELYSKEFEPKINAQNLKQQKAKELQAQRRQLPAETSRMGMTYPGKQGVGIANGYSISVKDVDGSNKKYVVKETDQNKAKEALERKLKEEGFDNVTIIKYGDGANRNMG